MSGPTSPPYDALITMICQPNTFRTSSVEVKSGGERDDAGDVVRILGGDQSGDRGVETGEEGTVVLVMVQLHDLRADDRLQGAVLVGQLRQGDVLELQEAPAMEGKQVAGGHARIAWCAEGRECQGKEGEGDRKRHHGGWVRGEGWRSLRVEGLAQSDCETRAKTLYEKMGTGGLGHTYIE